MRYGHTSGFRDCASVLGTIEADLRRHSARFSGLAAQSGMTGSGLTHDGAKSALYDVANAYSVAADKAAEASGWLLATAILIEELNDEATRLEAEISHDNLLDSFFNVNESRLDALDQLAAESRRALARKLRDSVKNDVIYTKSEPTHSWWFYLPSAFPDAVRRTAVQTKDGFVEGFLAVPKIAVGLYERSAINYFVDRQEFDRKWQQTEDTVSQLGQAYDRLGPRTFFLTMGKELIKNPARVGGNILGGLAFGEVVSATSQVGAAARVTTVVADGPTDDLGRIAAGAADDVGAGAGSAGDEIAGLTWSQGKPGAQGSPGPRLANALQHYQDHGLAMGYSSPGEYYSAAKSFVSNPPDDVLTLFRTQSGDTVLYSESTNTMAILSESNEIRTFFNPGPDVHNLETNLDYFYNQGGIVP